MNYMRAASHGFLGQETQCKKGERIMLAICEECSKKYNIDESKMRGEKARFSCQECGHIIVVTKKKETTGQTGRKTAAQGQ